MFGALDVTEPDMGVWDNGASSESIPEDQQNYILVTNMKQLDNYIVSLSLIFF